MSSSSDTSFDIAPESPRTIYPEMQARISDARNSEIRRFPANWWFSSPPKIVHDDDEDEEEDEEEKEDPSIIRLPPRRDHESEPETSESEHPRITKLPRRRDSEPEPETGESDSEHSSRESEVERPNVSQPRLSNHTLEPSDSISNQDHRSTAGSIPRFAPPSQSISTDNRYVDGILYESADGAWMKRHVRYPAHPSHPVKRKLTCYQAHGANHSASSDQTDTLGALRDLSIYPTQRTLFSDARDLLAYFSEENASAGQDRGNGGGGGVNPRPEAYDDDFEEPFAPQGRGDADWDRTYA